MIKDFVVISLWAQDVAAAAHFYRDVLGLEMLHDDQHSHRPHFRVGDAFLVILEGRPRPAEGMRPERFPIFAFRVADLDQALESLATHAVELPWGVEEDADSRWAMFYDPAGNLIEIAEL